MTFIVHFRVDINPVAKGRPRYAKRGNFVSTYTPTKTRVYEEIIKDHAVLAMGSSEPLESPVKVNLEFGMPIPKSTPKKLLEGYLNGSVKHTKKPDVDNLVKAILDAMNEVVYLDDNQITRLTMCKKYSKLGYIEVTVQEDLE